MSPTFDTYLAYARFGVGASDAAAACGVTWTGRSALSAVTETALSRFVTSGSRCTRLSAMRELGVRSGDSAPRSALARNGRIRAARGAGRASMM